MNILIITDELYPNLNANSSIAYTVATGLVCRDCSVTVLGYSKNGSLADIDFEFDTVAIESIYKYTKRTEIYKNNRMKRVLSILSDRDCRRIHFNLRRKKAFYAIEYAIAIKKILKTKKIDCIVAFSAPIDSLRALNLIKSTPPIVSYKLDPWSTNYYIKDKETAFAEERQSDEKASAIIVTKRIFAEYQQQSSDLQNKLFVAEFPCVTKPSEVPNGVGENLHQFNENEINCVFSGNLYQDIRNPDFTLKLFEKVKDHKIRLHIFGGQYGDCLGNLPSNVSYYGYVTQHELKYYIDKADFLVNIGNTVANQVPSKIYSYISYGKPIINFVKSDECPTLECLAEYPLTVNILENSDASDEAVEILADFCFKEKGKTLDWEQIEKLYYNCTPNYVVENLYDIIINITSGQ